MTNEEIARLADLCKAYGVDSTKCNVSELVRLAELAVLDMRILRALSPVKEALKL